jgi:hypothetical protein
VSSPTSTPSPAPSGAIGPFDRTVVVRVVLGVLALCVACVVATLVAAPDDPGSTPAFEQSFLGSCTRSGAAEDACRCALERWAATVPDADRAGLDERLAGGEPLPAEVGEALAGC